MKKRYRFNSRLFKSNMLKFALFCITEASIYLIVFYILSNLDKICSYI